jgi:hypothetical protein
MMRGTMTTGLTAAVPFAAAMLFFLMKDTTLGGRNRTWQSSWGDPDDFIMYSMLSAALGAGILAGSTTAGSNWQSTAKRWTNKTALEGKF